MGISDLLNRPIEQRQREFRYRCAQAFVFGVPVLALQWLGPKLGGAEAPRWIALLQAILTGWIVYIGALAMLVEGLLVRSTRLLADTIVAALATGMYLYSLITVIPVLIIGRMLPGPRLFHWVVMMLIVWTGLRCWQLSRSSTIDRGL